MGSYRLLFHKWHAFIKTGIMIFVFFILMASFLPLLFSQDESRLTINGVFSSILDLENARLYPSGDGDEDEDGEFSYGWENIANIRFKSIVNEFLSFSLSMNFIAFSGFYTTFTETPIYTELERLYFKADLQWSDLEAGLIRIPRGYGYVFSPLDILAAKDVLNSLDPGGRPRGKWGVHFTFYPQDMWKIETFGLAPDNPLESAGWGSSFGAATTFSLGKTNVDALYTLVLPEIEPGSTPLPPYPQYTNDDYTQIAGIALKTDIEIGLFVEALYRFEHRVFKENSYYGKPFRGYEGLEAAFGIDYTFSDLNLYTLAEYMFYGPGYVDWDESSVGSLYITPEWINYPPQDRLTMLDPLKKPLPFARHDYLFLMSRYSPGQDLSLGISALTGLDDLSALATAFCEYQVIQGLSFQISFLYPIDRRLFDSEADAGELGSLNLGFNQMLRLGIKVKF